MAENNLDSAVAAPSQKAISPKPAEITPPKGQIPPAPRQPSEQKPFTVISDPESIPLQSSEFPIAQDPITEKRVATKSSQGESLPDKSSISGRSILSILDTPKRPPAVEPDKEDAEEEEATPPEEDVEGLLVIACARFAQELMEQRPRIGNVFRDAVVVGNRVQLSVPNESSYDELTAGLTEMKIRLAQLSGVSGGIEFDVKITADAKGLPPIKVEDRMRHLVEKNPLLDHLRRELDLDTE